MDNSKEFRSIELCAGYGGIHLGLDRVIRNLRTIAFVEIEAFACANLVAKMEGGLVEPAPIWTDIKTFNTEPFRDRIHIITGGYPCQPFSTAGKRLGEDDPRHLWPHIRKIIKTIRPVFCFFENVEGHLSLGFKEVQQSLRNLGYRVEAGIFSAAEVGAPQQRKRLFILAHNDSRRLCEQVLCEKQQMGTEVIRPSKNEELAHCESNNRRDDSIREATGKNKEWGPTGEGGWSLQIGDKCSSQQWPSRPGQPQHEWEPPRVVANSVSLRKSQPKKGKQDERGRSINESESLADTNPWMRAEQSRTNKRTISGSNGQSRGSCFKIKSQVGRNLNGTENRMDNAKLYQSCDNRTDELRLLGNGVVPEVAAKAFVNLYNKMFDK